MRGKPFVRRERNGFAVRFVGAQRDLVGEALLWLAYRREGESVLQVWAGCGKQQLEELHGRIQSAGDREYVVLSAGELHTLHAVLTSVYCMFASEEAFHEQLGFYRENLFALVSGLMVTVSQAATAE
ncbi:hypothetical protein [Streptomyces roseochromogenus]|uniref:hypothetical protein n=1 Tax=Streptomyces roseochromogenus TaxID=285450 RepID=UPI000A7C9430|nr:hypothetical protein [Streptomyces roseochromogenus]